MPLDVGQYRSGFASRFKSHRLLVGGYWHIRAAAAHCEHVGPEFLLAFMADGYEQSHVHYSVTLQYELAYPFIELRVNKSVHLAFLRSARSAGDRAVFFYFGRVIRHLF
jgi:hypothetical protein